MRSPLTQEELDYMLQDEGAQSNEQPDVYTQVLNIFTQRNTESLVKCKYASDFYFFLHYYYYNIYI